MKRGLVTLLWICLLLLSLSAAAASPTLRPGSRGPEVIALQEALRAAGFDLKVDGVYGRVTSGAVSQYQRAKGLKQDGIAGPLTLGSLTGGTAASPTTPPSPSPTPPGTDSPQTTAYSTLRVGMRSSAVRALQEALIASGLQLKADGVYGRATSQAVRAWQAKAGLKADGVAGPQTLSRLFGGAQTGSPPATETNSPPAGSDSTASVAQTLRRNGNAQQIRLMQQSLNSAGGAALTADGVFGSKTIAALRSFQRRYGLPATGTADPNTLALLYLKSGQANDALMQTAVNDSFRPLTIRSGMSNAASAVQTVPAGGAMTLLSAQDAWSLVSYKHLSGYVESSLLQLIDRPAPLKNLARGFEQSAYTLTGDAKADLMGLAFTQLGFRGGSSGNPILDGTGPGGPYSKYGDLYQDPSESYCSYFISWSARQAGIPGTVINDARDVDGLFYDAQDAFVYFFAPKAAQVQAQKLKPASRTVQASYHPTPGDLIYLRWNDAKASTTFSHIGIVYRVDGDRVYTLEGAAGGSVDTRLYSLSNPAIMGYAKPRY